MISEEQLEKIKKDAWQEGYDEAIQRIRIGIRLHEMGLPHCEIVKRTDLPPVIIHAITGED